jgi:hypothetical protein
LTGKLPLLPSTKSGEIFNLLDLCVPFASFIRRFPKAGFEESLGAAVQTCQSLIFIDGGENENFVPFFTVNFPHFLLLQNFLSSALAFGCAEICNYICEGKEGTLARMVLIRALKRWNFPSLLLKATE